MVNIGEMLAYMFPKGRSFIDWVVKDDGAGPFIETWNRPEPQPTPAEIAAAVLPATKAARIAQINAECKARIFGRWPLEKQMSATLGIYGAESVAMRDWVDRHIAASNVASDQVDTAATVAAVEAVAVAWPV